MDLLCQNRRTGQKGRTGQNGTLPQMLCLRQNVLITSHNKIIKILFYQTSLPFPDVDRIVHLPDKVFYRRSLLKIELFIFAVQWLFVGFIAGILRNNSDRGPWDRMKYFHIICYSRLRHSANFESTLSMELNSSPL